MTVPHLADYLEQTAARFPNHIAVRDGSRQITYRELNRQADALGACLAARGIERGDRIGVVLPKSIEALVAFFAAAKSNAAYVPIDAASPHERIRRIIADCDTKALVLARGSLDVSPARQALVLVGEPTGLGPGPADSVSYAEAVAGRPAATEERRADDLAYIIYTSGSTGTPKGVMITHRNATSFVDWCASLLNPTTADRVASHTPLHFDASVQDVYPAIRNGATLCLISDDLARNPRALAQFIVAEQLTIWSSTPSALMLLLEFGQLADRARPHLRVVSFGGEVFPVKYLRELRRHWPEPAFYNMYGPTETTTTCTYAQIPQVIPADRDAPYPIGFPCPHCRALVLDAQGREAPAGQPGVLHISGPSVFGGYWNRPDETAAALIERDGLRWYNTGDVVRWDPSDGLTFIGRQDGMVKRRGYRIEIGEIERALYEHPSVREAAVVPIGQAESGVVLVAFVSSNSQPPLTIVELKAFCASKMPAYMVPDRFVLRDALPKTSTSKTDYQALRTDLAAADAG